VDDQLYLAGVYAQALGTTVPALPEPGGESADNAADAFHYLLQVLPRHYGDELADLYGDRFSAIFEAALKIQLVMWVYHPDSDSYALAALAAVERAMERAGVPSAVWAPPGAAVRERAAFPVVRDAVLATTTAVDDYLASLQIPF